jgi:hypothetical protein
VVVGNKGQNYENCFSLRHVQSISDWKSDIKESLRLGVHGAQPGSFVIIFVHFMRHSLSLMSTLPLPTGPTMSEALPD